jgi:hypothetical protein
VELIVVGSCVTGKRDVDAVFYSVAKIFLRDCQQISAHPSERNASWIRLVPDALLK